MKKLVITLHIASLVITSGCTVPEKPEMRIAISRSPGSSLLFIAEQAGLFAQYDVDVDLVELNSPYECTMAMVDHHVDAIVVPFEEFTELQESGVAAGVVMVVAAPRDSALLPMSNHDVPSWTSFNVEVLLGNRSELTSRRQEWQRLLLAYEHARLLLSGERNRQALLVSKREQRSSESLLADLDRWTLFGLSHQDSLLGAHGPWPEIVSQWHGRHLLKAAAASRVDDKRATDDRASGRDNVR